MSYNWISSLLVISKSHYRLAAGQSLCLDPTESFGVGVAGWVQSFSDIWTNNSLQELKPAWYIPECYICCFCVGNEREVGWSILLELIAPRNSCERGFQRKITLESPLKCTTCFKMGGLCYSWLLSVSPFLSTDETSRVWSARHPGNEMTWMLWDLSRM